MVAWVPPTSGAGGRSACACAAQALVFWVTVTATAAATATAAGSPSNVQTLTLAAGCFWSVELVFQRLPGVIATSVGYAGGSTANPRYEDVARGRTGHAEAVQVTFDADAISLAQLLDVFFEIHDPTTPDRQGNDRGTQYRSVLFYADEVQRGAIQEAVGRHQARFQRLPIVTAVLPLERFWVAEDDHQQFLQKGGQDASKGSLVPIQCYGRRGPIKHVSEKPAFLAAVARGQGAYETAAAAATLELYKRRVKRAL